MTNRFKEVKARLKSERNRLTEELTSKLGEGGFEAHEGSPYGKWEETATESLQLESRIAAVHHIRERLAEVEHALKKLANGTYGLCDSCGKPISIARLEAIP